MKQLTEPKELIGKTISGIVMPKDHSELLKKEIRAEILQILS